MIEGCVLNHSELGSQTKDALRSISLFGRYNLFRPNYLSAVTFKKFLKQDLGFSCERLRTSSIK